MGLYFPKSKTVKADLLKKNGGVEISCKLQQNAIHPALFAQRAAYTQATGITFAGYTPHGGGLVIVAGGRTYLLYNSSFVQLAAVAASSPFLTEGGDMASHASMLILDSNCVYMQASAHTVRSFSGNLACGVTRCGRLFGADLSDGYMLKWSGESGINDWAEGISGAGRVYLDRTGGKVLNMFNFEDKIVLVREHGVGTFSAYGTPENFSVGATALLPSIYKNTAAIVGNKLFVCAADGVYAYGGGKVEKFSFNLADDIGQVFYATAYLGRYYIVCARSKVLLRKVLYVIDISEKHAYIVDLAAEVATGGDLLYAFTTSAAYTLAEGGTFKYLCGSEDFGTSAKKVLKYIDVDCDGAVTLQVSNGTYTRTFSSVKRRAKVRMSGQSFTVTITGSSKVRSLTACAEVIDGV